MRPADLHFPRLVSIVTGTVIGIVVVTIGLVLPLAYFSIGYSTLASTVETKAQIKAEIITQLIGANPDIWRFEEHRMRELLNRYPVELQDEWGQILDEHGTVLAASDHPVASPALARSAGLFDSGTFVGRVEIHHSLRALIERTAIAGLVGALLAGTVFVMLRTLPARARRIIDVLFEENERAQVTLHSIGDAVITTDSSECIEYFNPAAESLTGWTLAEARGRPLAEVLRLIDEATLGPAENPLRRAMREKQARSFDGQAALVRRDESTIAIDLSAAPIHDRDGGVIGGVTVFHDVSAARSMAQRITWAATHDALTGLVNRREFEIRVDAALDIAHKSAKHHALCYIDLDQFKIVNDTCGHAAGDELLKQLAAVLQSNTRESDTLARLGGDEFGVLLNGCPLDRAQLIAADLLTAVKDVRFKWDDKVFAVGASIGLVAITADSSGRAEIFSAADAACYAAKEQGGGRVCVFRSADADIAQRHREMNWVGRLTRAIEENRLTLYYQSYLPLAQGGVEKKHIEILLRLIDEDGNLVLPGNFLPAAERYNIMPEIDRWVIKTAFSRYHDLALKLGTPLVCAINLSGTSLNAEGLLDFIREQMRVYDLPRGAVCFEITETAAINNLRRAAQFMKEVKELGFRFALDDFGTGTSSFGYLRSLPVDYLKIDGSFVEDIANDSLDKAMTETINRIGHIMGMKTVGEFAATEAVIGMLRSMGVDFAQGYGFEKPQPLP
jgi:diguanylate cyclase (GGDEF)-like protein/PAS domain S-box-containing protein